MKHCHKAIGAPAVPTAPHRCFSPGKSLHAQCLLGRRSPCAAPTERCSRRLSSSWWQRCRPLSPAAQGQVGLLPNQAVQKPAPQDRWNTSLKPRWSRLRRRPCRKQPKAGERGWEGPGGAGRGQRQEGAGPGQGGLAGGHILLERGRPATRELGTTKALSWIESWSPKGGSPS